MLLSKFSWCNWLTITQLGRLFASSIETPATDIDLRRADRINNRRNATGARTPINSFAVFILRRTAASSARARGH